MVMAVQQREGSAMEKLTIQVVVAVVKPRLDPACRTAAAPLPGCAQPTVQVRRRVRRLVPGVLLHTLYGVEALF
jgi:hypothetical protein